MAGRRFQQIAISLVLALTLGVPGVGATQPASKIVINIPSRTLWVYSGNKIVDYFPVGVGRPGFMTPMGQFSVIRKIVDPGWEHPYKAQGAIRIAPGENNPLGSRWIGFYQKAGGEYGMHGTDNPASVGRFSSHGCVRMKTRDVEKLFEMVDVGTPVEVVYQPVLIRRSGNDIRLIVYPDVFRKWTPNVAAVRADILRQYPNAKVDIDKITTALSQAAERPFVVGSVSPAGLITQNGPEKLEQAAGKPSADPLQPTDSNVTGPMPAHPQY